MKNIDRLKLILKYGLLLFLSMFVIAIIIYIIGAILGKTSTYTSILLIPLALISLYLTYYFCSLGVSEYIKKTKNWDVNTSTVTSFSIYLVASLISVILAYLFTNKLENAVGLGFFVSLIAAKRTEAKFKKKKK